MRFEPGALVSARGREWVVLPGSTEETLLLRPLGGRDDEGAGIYLPEGEEVTPASFALPDSEHPGDWRSCHLLRTAVRLGFRSAAGPFRSFAGIAFEPRSYQLVPLLMALKLDPVRILIADDVGIGKTIEASLIAKELLERGEATGLAVLTPPHLAEQWHRELRDKFHLETELVLANTAPRLERSCHVGQSLFEVHRHVVVSMDFIRSERRRDEFLRACPGLVIVDEAHTATFAQEGRGRHLRHELLVRLAADRKRHLVLVTATPHSGKDEAFHSLIGLLDPTLAELPADLTGPHNEPHRRRLARHFVQRRRGDIRHYLAEDTPFPQRDGKASELTFEFSAAQRRFFDRILEFARETVEEHASDRRRQRVRWWSALALLRSVASSPRAAAATLRNRAAGLDAESPDEVDLLGEAAVLDRDDGSDGTGSCLEAGADFADDAGNAGPVRRRLLEFAREAEALEGAADHKLTRFLKLLDELLDDGRNPIVFCRFIPTAGYLAEAVRKHVKNRATVEAVTGTLAPEDREARVNILAASPRRILICTDCLSEGINLQESFDAVVHYDLSWNPTRHEQREGRVDRYGQPAPTVRTVLYYGTNNPMDGLILEVLLRKHQTIKSSLGISVPVPMDTSSVVNALAEALLLRKGDTVEQLLLPGVTPTVVEDVQQRWDAAAEREKRSRTMFAQETIKPEEVAAELAAERVALGARTDIESFVREALGAAGAHLSGKKVLDIDLRETPRALRDALGGLENLKACFDLPVPEGALHLIRSHPLVQGLAAYLMDTALDAPVGGGPAAAPCIAARTGVVRTAAVTTRTTLLLLRDRFHIHARTDEQEDVLLAEDARLAAFQGSPSAAVWLDSTLANALLDAVPTGNIAPEQARQFLREVVTGVPALRAELEVQARLRATELLAAHQRVSAAARQTHRKVRVEPKLPVDVLGIWVLLPAPRGS